ncbi:MAG: DUF1501 domain-containing protein [Chloroflexi bacterium]|nr:DUF1501 domain-containing protein [Chloroflexota bacterium]
MTLTRRELLKNGALMVALGLTVPAFLAKAVTATQKVSTVRSVSGREVLVVIQLSGGNDGLNTIVPYGDPRYYEIRPTLAIPREQVLPLDDRVGLHPSLAPLKPFYDNGRLGIAQSISYPNPNRSHFRSMEIWQTATPERFEQTGWLGRYLDACGCGHDQPLDAINVGDTLNRSFWTEMSLVPAIGNVATFQFQTDPRAPRDRASQVKALENIYNYAGQFRPYEEQIRRTTKAALAGADELKRIAGAYQPTVDYPADPFANGLKSISQVIASDLGTRIFFLQLGGFDTHANQATTHANLLGVLANGLAAFLRDLENQGRADDVLVMTFSEFGRRPNQNASGGTDHGTAEPMFLLGGSIRGGLHNAAPNLTELADGDLQMASDFRSVYASVVQDWLGADPVAVVGPGVQPLALLA